MTQRSRTSFPLGALFVLVAVCAVLAALVAPLGRGISAGAVNPSHLLGAIGAGTVFVGILGAIVGAHHYRWILGAAMGLGVGAAIGAFCGALVLVPAGGFPALMVASLGGAAIMIGAGALFRAGGKP